MTSFCRVLELMEEENITLEHSNEMSNSRVIGAIRAGLNIDPQFWDNFLKVCNQSAALSELLGVRKEVIANWPNLIRNNLEQVRVLDGQDAQHKRANLIQTGYQ